MFIADTVTCSMSRSICCLSLFIVKLIYLFIYYVSFFCYGIFYSGEIKIWEKDFVEVNSTTLQRLQR